MSELTPYICVADSRAAIDWYGEHLGAQLTVEPIIMDDGRVGRAARRLPRPVRPSLVPQPATSPSPTEASRGAGSRAVGAQACRSAARARSTR